VAGNGLQNTVITVIVVAALGFFGNEAVKSMEQTRTNKEDIQETLQTLKALNTRLELELQLHEAQGHEHSGETTVLPDDEQGDSEGSLQAPGGTGEVE
jgi:hypothetical protein